MTHGNRQPKTLMPSGKNTSSNVRGVRSRNQLPVRFGGPVSPLRSGLVFPQNLPLRAWEKIGQELRGISDSSSWWLADWLIYGESAYNGRYREAIERTGLDYQTLRNYAWVARRFDISRRWDNLSFAHHAEVASLEFPEQDYWLRKAEEMSWSRNQLRKQVRDSLAERRIGNRPEQITQEQGSSAKAVSIASHAGNEDPDVDSSSAATEVAAQILLPPEKLQFYEETAISNGLSLTDWVAHALEYAADHFSAKLAPDTSR